MAVFIPYLTADLPGIGGRIKQYLDDFQVRELPLRRAATPRSCWARL